MNAQKDIRKKCFTVAYNYTIDNNIDKHDNTWELFRYIQSLKMVHCDNRFIDIVKSNLKPHYNAVLLKIKNNKYSSI